MRRVYLGGGDKISSYGIGGHSLVMYLTSVAISRVQVGVLLRLCFEPTVTVIVGSKHSLNKAPTCTISMLTATLVKYITRLSPPIL